MPRLLMTVSALTVAVGASSAACAFGPAFGLDADIGQLKAGLHDSDPASNAPNAGGMWTELTGSNFTPASGPTVRIHGAAPRLRVIRAPRITITP